MRIPRAELKTAARFVGVLALPTFVGLSVALSAVTGWAFGTLFS